MRTKRTHEGRLLVDNRFAPGPDGTTFLEAATITCSHCTGQLIRNPSRERGGSHERAWCSSCDRYICDQCEIRRRIDGRCKTFKAFMEEQDALHFKRREI